MEPFRPMLDLFVAENASANSELSPVAKRKLVDLVNYNIVVDGKKYALTYAIDRCIKSFTSLLMEKRKDLLMPKVIALERHRYE